MLLQLAHVLQVWSAPPGWELGTNYEEWVCQAQLSGMSNYIPTNDMHNTDFLLILMQLNSVLGDAITFSLIIE